MPGCFCFVLFFSSCHGVPSSQMDAVKQLNDACFPLLAVAIAAVHMQRQAATLTRLLDLSAV